MKINNINVSVYEFHNALICVRAVLSLNKRGIETTWPTIYTDGKDVFMYNQVGTNQDVSSYYEETRLTDNASITCGVGADCFWTSYPEET